jgi:hypothetical protein
MLDKKHCIFHDDGWGLVIVLWDIEKFKKAYIETQNEYWYSLDYDGEEKYVDYSVFYEHVREKLEWTWVEIIDRPMNVYHNDLDYNYDNYVEIQQRRRPLPTT